MNIELAAPWNDLFVRTDVREVSPENRYGGVGSPDILPVGTTPPVNPWDYITPASYATYINNSFLQNAANLIYIRAKNSASTDSASGSAYLYLTDPSLVLWPGPGKWTKIKTQSGVYKSVMQVPGPSNTVPAGAIALTYSDPFVYTPPDSGHRCLVTMLATEKHPYSGDPPLITTMDQLAKWLIEHPNYAHHNIDIIPNTTGRVTKYYPYSSGSQSGSWTFGLTVQGVMGYKVSFYCAKPTSEGKYIQLAEQTVVQNDPYTLTVTLNVEAGFDSTIQVMYDPQNITPKPDWQISFKAIHNSSSGHPLYAYGQPYSNFGVPAKLIVNDDRGIVLGSMTMMGGK